jgi:hypothetical protein
MQCLKEAGEPAEQVARVEFRDDNRYELTCPVGHVTVTLLQQQKFELLFEIGAYAISDGYYREAVSSFTSALERFYEFAIRVLMERRGKNDPLFQECWSVVSRQSERQLGAFVFLWAAEFGRKPDLLSNARVEFRNDVIHRGRIPTKEEAVAYGDSVLERLLAQMSEFQSFVEEVRRLTVYHLVSSRVEADHGKSVATLCLGTLVSLAAPQKYAENALGNYVERLALRKAARSGAVRGNA